MSKVKKYLLLASGILLLAWAGVTAYYAISGILNPSVVDAYAYTWSQQYGINENTMTWLVRGGVSYLSSSAVVSLGFGAIAIRYAFLSSKEFEYKRSIIITMAVLSVIISPVISPLFLVATLMTDKNYVPEEEAPATSAVDNLEEKLLKLNQLKEKGLITEEEYTKLRANILSTN